MVMVMYVLAADNIDIVIIHLLHCYNSHCFGLQLCIHVHIIYVICIDCI